MVDIIAALLADRADAAAIMAAVALRLAPAPPSAGTPPHHEQPASQPAMQQPAAPPPSIEIVKELGRAERDAVLLEQAVALSSSSFASSAESAISRERATSPERRAPPTPPPLITITTIPSNLLSSPILVL